jgi:putative ABC transport system permease protein
VADWLRTELSFDKFHKNSENIYRLTVEVNNPKTNYHAHFARSWYEWLKEIDGDIPGIEKLVRLSHFTGGIVQYNDESFKTNLFYTDPSFFNVFSVNFLSASPDQPLAEPNTLILSESAARKYFGDEDPLGKTLEIYWRNYAEKIPYTVIAIVKDFPENSHFHFDILASYQNPENTGWAYYYLLLEQGADPEEIARNFSSFAVNYVDEETLETLTPHLQNLEDIHLRSHKDREIEENGNYRNLWYFSLLGLGVLLLSIFNYVNLQFVGLISRMPSLGIMRILGAGRRSLLLLQTLEVVIISTFSALLSLVLLAVLFQPLNNLLGSGFTGSGVSRGVGFFLPVFGGLLLISIFAGLYPWIIMNIQDVMRKRSDIDATSFQVVSKQKMPMARLLVIIQFAATSIILIMMYFTGRQVNFFMDMRLGGDDAKILVVRNLPVQVINKYQVFKEKLLSNPLIVDVTSSFEDPADENMDMMHFETTGILPDVEEKMLYVYPADDNFFRFYDINFVAGSNFSKYYGNDSAREDYILNESALKLLGWEADEAIDKPFRLIFMTGDKNLFNGGRIVGIVEDFQPSSMKNEIKPYVYFQKSFWLFSSQIRYDESRLVETLDFVMRTWNVIYPGFPFEYTLIEDLYEAVYLNEIRVKNLGIILGILSVILSALGLWALTGVLYESRTKEMGIRRVHGATIFQVLWLLLREVFIMQVLSILLGLASAWYLVKMWLNNFPYRIEVSVCIFLLTALFILLIAFITAGYHAIRAVNRNPVESLRYE